MTLQTNIPDGRLPDKDGHSPLARLAGVPGQRLDTVEAQKALYMETVRKQTERLEELVDTGQLEELAEGQLRVGLEVEGFLIKRSDGTAAHVCADFLEEMRRKSSGNEWTSEMAEKMAEIRTEPFMLQGDALSKLSAYLQSQFARAREVAEKLGASFLPLGTLPTETLDNLTLEHIARDPGARPRYLRCNERALEVRDTPFHVQVGAGEHTVSMELDSLMAAGSICSIQPHTQCNPAELVSRFNLDVALQGYLIAATAGSPLVLGQEAQAESRIPVFEQAWEPDRVFTPDYIEHPVDPFKRNADEFEPIFYDMTPAGKSAHSLPELQTHNGTIHAWTRMVYGETDGVPHLRKENRPMSACPTPDDIVANAALEWGLNHGMLLYMKKHGISSVAEIIPRETALETSQLTQKDGLDARVYNPLTAEYASAKTVTLQLLAIARTGLEDLGVDQADIDHFIGIIEGRVTTGNNLSAWIVRSREQLATQPENLKRGLTDNQIITLMLDKASRENKPVHTLPLASALALAA